MTSEVRQAWKDFECKQDEMTVIQFGPDRIRVAPPTAEAWQALASVMLAHDYDIRLDDTDSYNCRAIKGTTVKSLHSYGLALDVNWHTNPLRETPNKRKVRYSNKASQHARGQDVKLNIADTDMTPEMIDDIRAIKTNNGKTVFRWGGDFNSRKDAMHFEIHVTPADLATGIDSSTVRGGHVHSHLPADRVELPPLSDLLGGDASDFLRGGIVVEQMIAMGMEGKSVRALQERLSALNFPVGKVDGVFGELTRAGVLAFQDAHQLPLTGSADAATMAMLATAQPRDLSETRKSASVEDLRAAGSKTIELADWLRKLALGTGALGVFGISEQSLGRVLDGVKFVMTGVGPVVASKAGAATPAAGASGMASILPISTGAAPQADLLAPLFDVVKGVIAAPTGGLGALTIGAAFMLWRNASQIAGQRLKDHREGKNLGR